MGGSKKTYEWLATLLGHTVKVSNFWGYAPVYSQDSETKQRVPSKPSKPPKWLASILGTTSKFTPQARFTSL